MAYSFNLQDDGHILLVTLDEQYDMANDLIELSVDMSANLDEAPDGTIIIIDARAVQVKDLNSMLVSAQNITRPEVKANMNHPKLLKTFSVINNRIINAAMKGLNTATFGYVQTTLFETVEAAIAQAKTDLAEYRAR